MEERSQRPEEVMAKEETASEIDSSAEKRPGIFVRISPMAKEVLESAARGSSYGKVIERLLEYFQQQEPEFRNKILSGVHINPLKASQDLIARLHRAQHAFENKRFYYAIETYLRVADELRDADSSEELLEVCHYRLGHCLIRWSYELRAEALSPENLEAKSSEDFGFAQKALDLALRFLGKVKAEGDTFTKLVSYYNRACCYSLKAQYMVESKLNLGKRIELYNAIKEEARTQDLWAKIGNNWRENNDDPLPDKMAKDVLRELRQVYSPVDNPSEAEPSMEDSSLTSGRIWLVEISNNDEDLTFMRCDQTWNHEFDKWRNALQKDGSMKAVEPILQRCTQLLDAL